MTTILSSERFDVVHDAESQSLLVHDRATNLRWETPGRTCTVPVSPPEPGSGCEVVWITDADGLRSKGKVSLLHDGLRLEVTLPTSGAAAGGAHREADSERPAPVAMLPPLLAQLDDPCLCFCDRSCGVLIRANDSVYSDRRLEVYGNVQCLDMPWIGVLDGPKGAGYLLHVETPFDARVWLQPQRDGSSWPAVEWMPVLGEFAYVRAAAIHFIDGGGYVALANRYRSTAAEEGKLVTLENKAADRSAVRSLAGSPIVWGDLDAAEFAHTLRHIAGIDRAVLANSHMNLRDKSSLRRLNDEGFITTEYDSIGDITEGEPGPQSDHVEPTAYRWSRDSGPAAGWRTLEGLQYYFRSSACAMAALRSYVPNRLADYGFNARFMDVAAAIGLFEDYHPDHTFDRRTDMTYRRECIRYFRDLGLVVGAEYGNDWAVDLVDYYEGSTSGPFWWATDRFAADGWNAGHLREPTHRDQFPPEYLSHGMGTGVRIPLWDLVYHDCVVGTWYWGDVPGFMHRVWPELADMKDCYTLLYGATSLVWREADRGYGWLDDRGRARLLQTLHYTAHFHRRVAFDRLTDHEFLSTDGTLQRTRFSSGASVLANFSESPQRVDVDGEALVLAPRGFSARAGDLSQRRIMRGANQITVVSCDGLLRVDGTADEDDLPIRGHGSITLFRRTEREWGLTLEAGSEFEVDAGKITGMPVEPLTVRAGDSLQTLAIHLE